MEDTNKDTKNPCDECLIKVTCQKSFINKSACDELWEFVLKTVRRRCNDEVN